VTPRSTGETPAPSRMQLLDWVANGKGGALLGRAKVRLPNQLEISDIAVFEKDDHLTSEVPEADRLPIFRLGGQICARKTTLLNWIAERERSGGAPK
jgi:hypothetical protein